MISSIKNYNAIALFNIFERAANLLSEIISSRVNVVFCIQLGYESTVPGIFC
jgi:hypothetical protein